MSQLSYLVVANISKKANVRQLLQVAFAYGLMPVVVGMQRIIEEMGTVKDSYLLFDDMAGARMYFNEMSVPLIGIEIGDEAASLNTFDFPSCIALMPGNEGTGLNLNQRRACDMFVYIPQFGSGIESLNVTVATTIVIHEFFSRKQVQI